MLNLPTPISSDQADLRLDQNITSKQLFYIRGTYKKRNVDIAPTGSPLLGAFSTPEIDFGIAAAHNWIISANLVNEARVGFNGNHTATTFGASPAGYATELRTDRAAGQRPGGGRGTKLQYQRFSADRRNGLQQGAVMEPFKFLTA